MMSGNPDDGNDARALGRAILLAQQGQMRAALAGLERCRVEPPLDVAADLLRAQWLAPVDVEACWSTYTQALARAPNHPMLALRAGVFAFERGDLAKARTLLERSWAAAPTAEAGFYLGKIHAGSGNVERALGYFVQSVACDAARGAWQSLAQSELRALIEEGAA